MLACLTLDLKVLNNVTLKSLRKEDYFLFHSAEKGGDGKMGKGECVSLNIRYVYTHSLIKLSIKFDFGI